VVLNPGDVSDKWNYTELEGLILKRLDVKINHRDGSVTILVPVLFEVGVALDGNNPEMSKQYANVSRINPDNDGKYLPIYRGYIVTEIAIGVENDRI
jgi:hypothetical protein